MASSRHPGARFSNPAELYDLIYHWKDYQAESAQLVDILGQNGVGEGSRVLEGACGTGRYLVPLSTTHEVAGFDLDADMLAVARRQLPPTAQLFKADLRSWSLPPNTPSFDALLLLFGGIGYVPPSALPESLSCLWNALRPGGLLLLEPWVPPSDFVENEPHMASYETRWLKVCRQCVTRRDGDIAVLEFHYLVSRPGFEVEHLTDTQRLWLCELETLSSALTQVGFEVRQTKQGFMPHKDLLFCHRPA